MSPRHQSSSERRGRRVAARQKLDAFAPVAVVVERERIAATDGKSRLVDCCTVFLRGSECPFSCVFCDLWQDTLLQPTPRGALPHQLDLALRSDVVTSSPHTVKLYNASNFFDERAVPAADDAAIAALLSSTPRVVVECHPRLVRTPRCARFAERLAGEGGRLEVALGLESAHREVFSRLNKGCDLEEFERASAWLLERNIAVRAFVLCGLPWLAAPEADEAVLETLERAATWGIESVTIIPVRASEELLRHAPQGWGEPTLERFDSCVGRARRQFDVRAQGALVVRADLWDLDRLRSCTSCGDARREALVEAELSTEPLPAAGRQPNRTPVGGSGGEEDTCPGCGYTAPRRRAAAADQAPTHQVAR